MNHDKSGKRRAIYTALKPFLTEKVLLKALAHWDTYYGANPNLTLQQYVSEIARGAGLKEQRSSMLLSLTKAMNAPVATLLPEPGLTTEQLDILPTAATASIFVALMTGIMNLMPPASQRSVFFDLLASVNRDHLPPNLLNALTLWIEKEQDLALKPHAPRVLRVLVNRTYVVMCERLGPVEADNILARAANDCGRIFPQFNEELTRLL